jgi:DNA-binding NarL/FixJ family response regulator
MSSNSKLPPANAGSETPNSPATAQAAENGSGPDSSLEFRIFIVDRDTMSSNLLAAALCRDRNFRASAVQPIDLLGHLEVEHADMVIIDAEVNQNSPHDCELTQAVKRAHPRALIVMLLNYSTRDSVLKAFRSGAQGIFSRQHPITKLLECVEHVRRGYIWAAEQETTILLEAIRSIPSLHLVQTSEPSQLTYREEQVVQAAARGKTNKVIAGELGLSEHTVKNYLFRAFEKLGVSNRVELLFYLTVRERTPGPGSAG